MNLKTRSEEAHNENMTILLIVRDLFQSKLI